MSFLREHSKSILGVAVMAGLLFYIQSRPSPQPAPQWSLSSEEAGRLGPRLTTTRYPNPAVLHILFIGNSFTFVGDIPGQMGKIASSDDNVPYVFDIQTSMIPSSNMKMHWGDGKAQAAIRKQPWTYVVLQEESIWAMFEANRDADFYYTAKYNDLIRADDAQGLLYLTWPDKAESDAYTGQYKDMLRDPVYSMQKLDYYTHKLGYELRLPVIEVGRYWMKCVADHPEIDLYAPDSHHPSMAGSYLSTLVFYKTLAQRDVTKITFVPPGVSEKDARTLRQIANGPVPAAL